MSAREIDPQAQHSKLSRCSTNAECLKRGLPLIRPAERATRTGALKPRASLEVSQYGGAIAVYDVANSNLLGYVARTVNNGGAYTLTSNPGDAIVVGVSSDGANAYDIIISAETRSGGYPYLGAVFNGPNGNMGAASNSFAFVVGVANSVSTAGTQASNTRGNYGPVETVMWKYNPTSGLIDIHWINQDNTVKDVIAVYSEGSNWGLNVMSQSTYDSAAYKQDFGNLLNSKAVMLEIVNISI